MDEWLGFEREGFRRWVGESEGKRNIIGEVINDFGKEMFVKVEWTN